MGYRKRPVAWNGWTKIYTLLLWYGWNVTPFFSVAKTTHNHQRSIIIIIITIIIIIIIINFFLVKYSKVKTDMFMLLHYPHQATADFELPNVCWRELSYSSENYFIQKLIVITWRNQTWWWVEYLFGSSVWDRVGNSGTALHYGFSTNGKVLVLFWYHDVITSIWFLKGFSLRKI